MALRDLFSAIGKFGGNVGDLVSKIPLPGAKEIGTGLTLASLFTGKKQAKKAREIAQDEETRSAAVETENLAELRRAQEDERRQVAGAREMYEKLEREPGGLTEEQKQRSMEALQLAVEPGQKEAVESSRATAALRGVSGGEMEREDEKDIRARVLATLAERRAGLEAEHARLAAQGRSEARAGLRSLVGAGVTPIQRQYRPQIREEEQDLAGGLAELGGQLLARGGAEEEGGMVPQRKTLGSLFRRGGGGEKIAPPPKVRTSLNLEAESPDSQLPGESEEQYVERLRKKRAAQMGG